MTKVENENDAHNKSDLVAILTDYDRGCAPLDSRAIRLSLTADVAFIEHGVVVESYADGCSTTTFTSGDSLALGVDAELLLHTLTAMVRREDRMAADRARGNNLPRDHPAWTTVPGHVPATIRRA